jgi:hypothetical protein
LPNGCGNPVFFINRYKKGPAVPCGKPSISSLDNPLFFLRKKTPVHKYAFNPQAKGRYPEALWHLDNRV